MNTSQTLFFRLFTITLIFGTIVLDQLSKWGIMEHLIRPLSDNGHSAPTALSAWIFRAPSLVPPMQIEIFPFFNLVSVWNYGVSFGLFNGGGDVMPFVLMGLSGLVVLAFFIWMLRAKSRMVSVSLALVIGGAVGNIIDRVRFGAVFDFLDVHLAGYHWPAFNVADSFIVVGIFILLMHSVFLEKNGSDSR